ncbi:MAG TPA: hypothetical protein VE133_09265, partial [Candidatus Sulfotelmatobacter sp.]|nr:hypothetical protein [Candidatus Sulfotelmatobacter sp.]
MFFTRRNFLKTALVLSFDQILSIAPPLVPGPFASSALQKKPSSLDVSFIDIGRQAGFKTKTIFGGERK